MEAEVREKSVKLSLRKGVFFPPWLLLVAMVVVSLTNGEAFMDGLNTVTNCFLGALNEPYRGMCSGILCGIQRNMQINYVLNPKGCAIWPFVL